MTVILIGADDEHAISESAPNEGPMADVMVVNEAWLDETMVSSELACAFLK